MSYTLPYEALLLLGRAGDEKALQSLNEVIYLRRTALINAACVDINFNFSQSDREYIFQSTLEAACREFCPQMHCTFVHYLVERLFYAFSNLAKTKSEFAASINPSASKEPVSLLRDCSQKDENDLMGTLFTWKDDILALASSSTNFSERDMRIIRERLDNTHFAEIAEQEHCSLSTCKKVWKKFIAFAKKILDIDD